MTRSGRTSLFLVGISLLGMQTSAQTTRETGEFGSRAVFGGSVAVGDSEVLVGEPGNTYRSGIVYVYSRSGGNWSEAAMLRAPDAELSDGFGSGISVAGHMLAVSSTNSTTSRPVHMFHKDGNSWVHVASLMGDDVAEEDGFGIAVAATDDYAFVGAFAQNNNTGAVYVFQRQGTSYRQVAKLVGSDVLEGDRFGVTIDADGDVLLAAATRHDGAQGAVWAFHRNAAGEWVQLDKLEGSGSDDNDRFGSAIDLSLPYAVIGTGRHDQFRGLAHTFMWNAEESEWQEMGRLSAFDASPQTRFGNAMAIADGSVLVGAPGANGFRGTIYSLDFTEEEGFTRATKITPEELTQGSAFALTLAARGTVAVAGAPGALNGGGAAMILEKRMNRWEIVSEIESRPEGIESVTGGQVGCSDGQASMFDCDQVDLLSFLSVADIGGGRGVNVNDVWGWTDPTTRREYAIVGRTNGTSFVDITDPENPAYLGDLPLTEGANPAVWRDIKVYQNHAYIVADGSGRHGMQVFNLERLRGLRNTPVTFDEDAHYDGVASAHNVVINEQTGYAYIVGVNGGGETCGGGLHMVNIQNPTEPEFAGCFSDANTGNSGTGYSHDAMCVEYSGPDSEHSGKEICFGANETALSIADVSDKSNPVPLSFASYPNVGYAHQGWITPDQRYFYMNDELDELQGNASRTRTMVWDVTDLDDPILVREFMGTTEASDHNLYIKGNLMYQSNYQAGLRIIDISDPENPQEVGYFDTVPVGENEAGFGGSWSNYPYFESGTVIVTSGSEGLFLLREKQDLVP